jgi:hypothetical protein
MEGMQMTAGPKLRHEFVGMMFAITIGEVGLQAAALVKAGHPWHFLPAYSHLLLATIVIAASFVGWSLSPAPGAQEDVPNVLHPEFLVLLLDVLLVIVYFILVRSVEFAGEGRPPEIAPAERVAFWIVVIFFMYLVWDILTKIAHRESTSRRPWLGVSDVRILPTVLCLILALLARCVVKGADCPHLVTADLALLSLVLLFRALKDLSAALLQAREDLSSASSPAGEAPSKAPRINTRWAATWSAVFGLLLVLGLLWTARAWSLPGPLVKAIEHPSPPCVEPGLEPGSPR